MRAKQGEEADVVVLNTCSVTDAADHKGRQAAIGCQRRNRAFQRFLGPDQSKGLGSVGIERQPRPFRPMREQCCQESALILQRRDHEESTDPIGAGNSCYIVNVEICQRGCARFPIF